VVDLSEGRAGKKKTMVREKKHSEKNQQMAERPTQGTVRFDRGRGWGGLMSAETGHQTGGKKSYRKEKKGGQNSIHDGGPTGKRFGG